MGINGSGDDSIGALSLNNVGGPHISPDVLRVDAGTGIITKVAGRGTVGSSPDGTPTIGAVLVRAPVTVGTAGEFFSSDSFNHDVRKVDMKGMIFRVTGIGGTDGNPQCMGKGVPATSVARSTRGDGARQRRESALRRFSYDRIRMVAAVPLPALRVRGVAPPAGPAAGGTPVTVTVTGTGFSLAAGGTTVLFASTPATNVSCLSVVTCTAMSPAGLGTVDVAVGVGGLVSATGPADKFAYTSAALSPAGRGRGPGGGSGQQGGVPGGRSNQQGSADVPPAPGGPPPSPARAPVAAHVPVAVPVQVMRSCARPVPGAMPRSLASCGGGLGFVLLGGLVVSHRQQTRPCLSLPRNVRPVSRTATMTIRVTGGCLRARGITRLIERERRT